MSFRYIFYQKTNTIDLHFKYFLHANPKSENTFHNRSTQYHTVLLLLMH